MSTAIEWTDETWNPVTGCTKVSQGCKHCYAERLWPKVEAARVKRERDKPREFTDVRMHPNRLDAPLHWKKPRRIFVNSMSDLFHADVAIEFIGSVLGIAAACEWHTFQVLTKRPERMLEVLASREFHDAFEDSNDMHTHTEHLWPPRNVWLGVSVEDQETADERIPLLLQTPAAVRFLSCEPLLGPITFRWAKWEPLKRPGATDHLDGLRRLDWVIAGGESGPHARPSHPDWIRALRDQCAEASVPFFFKQWGEFAPTVRTMAEVEASRKKHVVVPSSATQLFPAAVVDRVGKKAAGRTLDGRIHDEYPRHERAES
jgi:protein gp37